jgi:hypothetical protein
LTYQGLIIFQIILPSPVLTLIQLTLILILSNWIVLIVQQGEFQELSEGLIPFTIPSLQSSIREHFMVRHTLVFYDLDFDTALNLFPVK